MSTIFTPGTTCRVVNPTGGVRRTDPFVVVVPPPHALPDSVYVRYTGEPDPLRPWTRNVTPMGFHEDSLEATS